MTSRRAVLRWRVMPALLVSLAAGLGSVVPAPRATASAALMAGSSASLAGPANPVAAHVTNYGSGTVTPIMASTNAAGPPIPVGIDPSAIAVTPDDGTVYAAIEGSHTVTPIATATNTAGPPIKVGNGPSSIAITSDSKTAYISNWYSGTVTPIATTTNTAGPPIRVGSYPYAIVIMPTTVTKEPTGPIVSGNHSTKCVDDSNDSAVNDTKIVMWDCDGSAAQNWTIAADGTIQINGKCMDIYRDEKSNKAPVELWTCHGGANQQWQPSNGTLVNPVSGKCLDDPRFNATDGTQLEIYTCNGGVNQQWKLP